MFLLCLTHFCFVRVKLFTYWKDPSSYYLSWWTTVWASWSSPSICRCLSSWSLILVSSSFYRARHPANNVSQSLNHMFYCRKQPDSCITEYSSHFETCTSQEDWHEKRSKQVNSDPLKGTVACRERHLKHDTKKLQRYRLRKFIVKFIPPCSSIFRPVLSPYPISNHGLPLVPHRCLRLVPEGRDQLEALISMTKRGM